MSGAAPPAAENARTPRMPCLDGLRGLAAIMVVFSHAPDFGFSRVLAPLCGAYGVLIFFGLSGFLMGDLYLTRRPTPDAVKDFIAARIARIAPIYYVVVVASFVVSTSVLPGFVYRFPPTQFVRLLTFNGSVSVFWSISPEVQFYFVFIPLWLLYARLHNPARFALLTLALAGLSILTISWWPGILVVSKFHIFASGVLAALLRRAVAPHLGEAAATAFHVTAIVLIVVLLLPGGADAMFGDPHAGHENDVRLTGFYGDPVRCLLAGFLAFSLSFDSRLGSAVFANPFASLLGRCSFSIYLLHIIVFFVLTRLDILDEGQIGLGTAVAVALTILVSAASYSLIEAPARARVRRLLLGLMNVRSAALPLHRPTA